MLKSDTLIDATLLGVSISRPLASGSEVCPLRDPRSSPVSPQDPGTGFTRRGRRASSASCPIALARWEPVRVDVAVDQGSELVCRVALTSAEMHGCRRADPGRSAGGVCRSGPQDAGASATAVVRVTRPSSLIGPCGGPDCR